MSEPFLLSFRDPLPMLKVSRSILQVFLSGGLAFDRPTRTFDRAANFLLLNHGIDLTVDGKTLFVSSETTVYSYAYDATASTIGAIKTVM